MKNIITFILIITAGYVVFLSARRGCRRCYSRRIELINYKLETVKTQMNALGGLLKKYQAKNGKYPGNDESLHIILDDCKSSFKVNCQWYPLNGRMKKSRIFTSEKNDELTGFVREEFEYLDATETFIHWFKGLPASDGKRTHSADPKDYVINNVTGPVDSYDFVIDYAGNAWLSDGHGPVSPWSTLPYIYENRNGLSKTLFADSLVNDDIEGSFSICVADGVFVYSVEGQSYANRIKALENKYQHTLSGVVKGIAAECVILGLIILFIKKMAWRITLLSILFMFLIIITPAISYEGDIYYFICSLVGGQRTPEMIQQQRDIYQWQRENNMIKLEAYEKRIEKLSTFDLPEAKSS